MAEIDNNEKLLIRIYLVRNLWIPRIRILNFELTVNGI